MRALAVLGSVLLLAAPAYAQQTAPTGPEWRHGTSLMGHVKYPAGFARFDYVNPDAPKGGRVRLSAVGSFDTFNPILPRGDLADGMGLIYDTLMTSALDEVSTEYGLVAEALQFPDDFAWVKYRIRPEARWHDGKPITAEDVVWSFEKTIELNPPQRFYYRHVVKAEITGEREITFSFDAPGNRELPHIVGQLLILPKHWWEGTDSQGRQRSINSGTLEPPLGSGPYRVKSFQAGRTISYERVPDYWGANLNVRIGANNFDEIRFDSYLDQTVLLEAFKGDQYDWRAENSARQWATGYDFPAVKDGRVVLEKFPDKSSGIMQAFVPNLRREQFKDARVRQALNYAFDFESLNRTVFYGEYKRDNSFFAGTELASSGVPEGLEKEILEEVRGKVPDALFTTAYENPVGGDPAKVRDNLRKALDLLNAAGWKVVTEALPPGPDCGWFCRILVQVGLKSTGQKNVLRNEKGEAFSIEYLSADPNFERVVLTFQQNLERLGIEMRLRVVDTSQYINRVRAFDFDMITFSWPQSLSPGNEQRDFFGSEAANNPASRNMAGIADPAVDRMIERVIYAKSREELVAATRALDRVLLWSHFVIPQWFLDYDRTARWNRFGRPEKLPEYSNGFPTIWWWDAKKAAATGGRT